MKDAYTSEELDEFDARAGGYEYEAVDVEYDEDGDPYMRDENGQVCGSSSTATARSRRSRPKPTWKLSLARLVSTTGSRSTPCTGS
jgi:hypothetical protein